MNGWLLLGILATASVELGDDAASTPSWLSSYDEARAAAARTGRPIFAVFR